MRFCFYITDISDVILEKQRLPVSLFLPTDFPSQVYILSKTEDTVGLAGVVWLVSGAKQSEYKY